MTTTALSLVGASFGGLTTQYFARSLPGDVAGAVLVDRRPERARHRTVP
jgi:pimeloyl-ACP methyl ester carboxylesterase